MTVVLLILLVLIAPLVVLLGRHLESKRWRRTLVAVRLRFAGDTSVDDIARLLGRIQVLTESPAWSLLLKGPIALEVVADHKQVQHILLVPKHVLPAVMASVVATMPRTRITELPDYFATRPTYTVAAEATQTHSGRPMALEHTTATSQHILASLAPLNPGQQVCVQWILSGARRPEPRSVVARTTRADMPWWMSTDALKDIDELRFEKAKYKTPLLLASLRVGVSGSDKADSLRVFGRVWPAFSGMDAPGVRLVRRFQHSSWVVRRIRELRLPLLRFPLTLNIFEAAGLLGSAADGLSLPGVSGVATRALPAPSTMPRRGGLVIAESDFPAQRRPLALSRSDRLRSIWALGPPGVGKSTLIMNMVEQDLRAGDGALVIDAKGDLTLDLLNRIPAERTNDVVILDPANTASVVGFNPLALGHDERGRELAAEHVLSVLHSLFRSSWGIRTADVLRASLLTMVHAHGADGSRLTLAELPVMLTDDSFRVFVVQQGVNAELARFWAWFNRLSETERAQVIGPVMNKLRQFLLSTPLRLTLGQSQGLDLSEVFTKQRVVIMPLRKGLIGTESSALIGSLVLSGMWQATLERAKLPPAQRRPAWMYVDEFQEVTRLPLDLSDVLDQSRGLGLGVVLMHQRLGQLSPEMRDAVLGSTRTQIVFQLNHDDARILAPRFAPLTADELTGLDAHHIAMRPSVGGMTLSPVTGTTYPPSEPTGSAASVLEASSERFAVERAAIEAGLVDRVKLRADDAPSHKRAKRT